MQVLSAVGMRQAMLALAPAFERATGHALALTVDAFGFIMKRLEGGEQVDAVLLPRAGLATLARAGRVVADSCVEVASSVAGVAVRTGAPRPDISTPEAFTRMLLAATAVARPDPATGGSSALHIVRVLDRLGVADLVGARSVLASRPDDARSMPGWFVADGRADVALHQVQELLAVPGIDVVGPFPPALQERFMFSAGVMTGARQPAAARALVAFLRTPAARRVIAARGMEPAAAEGAAAPQ